MLDVGRHPNIELMTYSQIEEVKGEVGDFKVQVRSKARYVDEDLCTACGTCSNYCPVPIEDPYDEGLRSTKAMHIYYQQAIPATYYVDEKTCLFLTRKECKQCERVCQAKAIDFNQKDRIVELDVGAIIVAIGYDVFDPSQITEYRYQEIPNVVTAIEFERLLSASGPTGGKLYRPSDLALQRKTEPLQEKVEGFTVAKRLAFVQCVGSRDFRFYPFCSGYCCMHSIKEAIVAHEHEPETTSTIFGMDIRAVGKGFEEYKLRGGNRSNITYMRGRIAEITEGPNNNPVVTYEDTKERVIKRQDFHMVILASACVPTKGIVELAEILGIQLDPYNFVKTDPLSPVDTTRPGVFVCGCAASPMDIPESVVQASSAAERAAEVAPQPLLEKGKAVA
jgi:heterodisulfide reductase subunit A